ncbi:MAG: undecaprenyl-diphosphate phosphatase [Planctomycetota bacterium]
MEILKTIFLAVVQGLTEFLPVSSSGHLVLFGRALHVEAPGLFLDLALHVGTVLAVMVVYRQEIWEIVRDFLALFFRRNWRENPNARFAVAIVVGSVPTAIIGLAFEHVIQRMFERLDVVGAGLIVTAAALWLTKFSKAKEGGAGRVGVLQAVLIGVAQGIAVIPGVSRSGATISCGLLLGVDRETAARFSFLLSIPAILGAAVWEASWAAAQEASGAARDVAWLPLLIGIMVSFAVGYLALKLLLRFVKRGKLHVFAYYCLPAGLLALALCIV